MTKILLIEDDPLIQRMYTKYLVFSGFEVDIAADGEEGILKVYTFNPQLILLDIMLPKRNGFEVLAELKSNLKTKNIPIIILSNLSQESNAETALTQGAFDYVIKSNNEPEDVIRIIKKALEI